MEDLGDEFSVPQDQGVILPKSSFCLSLSFRPMKPLNIRKMLRLEVSDAEKILGILHTENIHVTAEAYDVALDMTPDGCLDFGSMKVFEEAKLTFKMKNQGKYEIAFKFTLESADVPSVASSFTVCPSSGSLLPNSRPTTVDLIAKPTRDISIQEQPVLHCQVIEPKTGNGGETIAILTTNISLHSSFSRYMIKPAQDLRFGPLSLGCKRSQTFTIENSGIFETHFTIGYMSVTPPKTGGLGSSKKSRCESALGLHPAGPGKTPDMGIPQSTLSIHHNRVNVGLFSVSPRTGVLQPGSKQVVTVDCTAEQLGSWDEGLFIDINERDPQDHPDGIPYRLLAEVYKPGMSLDMSSIFEEHHLCSNSSQLTSEKFCTASSIYLLDENKFIFNKVVVGRTAQARFKFTNISKVPCQLHLTIRYAGTKATRGMEVFNLPKATLFIPSQSHCFGVLTFTPHSVQLYHAVFEAVLDASSGSRIMYKTKVLEFELVGEGILPSVCVMRPALRDHRGSPVLQFRRVLVGRRHTLPLVLMNDGAVPVQVHLNLLDKHKVFTLKAVPSNISTEEDIVSEHQLDQQVFCTLTVNEQAMFEVSFCSDELLSAKAKISLNIEDNHYSSTTIRLVGEAYQQVVSLENIRQSLQRLDEVEDGKGDYEVLDFGDCLVNYPCQESFTMMNHSSSQVLRFEWPADAPQVVFSPQVGHLHAGCSKEVTVTFCSRLPVTLTRQPSRCKICEVVFQQSLDQVADWDDRNRTVQWLSATPDSEAQPENNKVVKTDSEPPCSVVEGSQWQLDLRITAVCDYVKLSCSTDALHFKDTMLYQTRVHQLQIENQGRVKLDYSWQVLMSSSSSSSVEHNYSDEVFSSSQSSKSESSLAESRPGSALASMMSLRMGDPGLPPFSLEPMIGTVEPGAVQKFHVRFAPLEVATFQGKLLCSIPNLQHGDQAPCLPVYGRSLLPHCHFELEDSDYITANRRSPDFKSHLDPNSRVIEFTAVGINTPIRRCFKVLNPTSQPYSFTWICEDTGSSPFRCLTPSGAIQPGKKVEVCLEYVAEQLDTVESFWSFAIDTLSLSVPFLFVGAAREPLIYFNVAHLDLQDALVGRRVQQTVELVNGEEQRFHFSVLPSSLHLDDQRSSLNVQPLTGTLEPKHRVPLSVSFTPCQEGEVTFRLTLKVKKKLEPLSLSVKADCFTMATSVQVQTLEGGFKDIPPNQSDSLDFGTVGISEQLPLSLLVTNLTRVNLEVNFDLSGACELIQCLKVRPLVTSVEVGKQLQSSLVFCPRNICSLQDVKLTIKVKFGPTFTLLLKGEAVAPSLKFSFNKYNFGKCVVLGPGAATPSHVLLITNKGKRDISIQCQFKNTPYLETDFRPGVLTPGAVMEVRVTFCPQEVCRYHEQLIFTLNSCLTKAVDIVGQGVEMKLEVEDPKQKKVKLGSVVLGQKVKKQVTLVNRSLVELSFSLQLSSAELVPQDLTFSPEGELQLKASGGSCKVEIQFSPQQQIPAFMAELQAHCPGVVLPLLTVQGRCQGVEVHLDRDHLAFGAIVQRSQTTKRLVMKNAGEVGARFHWKVEDFPCELSILPVKGYICPDSEVPFEVTFAPVEVSSDFRFENLSCCVEGMSSPMGLTVTGSCVVASTSKEVLTFVCPVRGTQIQTLPVSNPTNQRCNIKPVIEGEQWSSLPALTLEPLQTKPYDITYRPLSMTPEGMKHQGSIFFSFPDGSGMLVCLQGSAEPPKAEDTLLNEIPAKALHTQLLPVHNCLSMQQRFHVLMEILKPDKHDPSFFLKGLEFIDVPAQDKKDYKISFYAHREGQYNTKVTFRNEKSGEYMFYQVNFKVTSPGVVSTIKLESTVRRTASACVQLENPLSTPTCFTLECKCPDINVPLQFTVPGLSKGTLSLEYQPLHAATSSARLSLHSNELGYFHYQLLLTALPPLPERPVHFQTSLGSNHTVLVKFKNYSHIKTEYSCKIDCPDFIVDKSIGASPGFHAGSDASVEVCFEPHRIGEVRGNLTLSSLTGGEYVFPLHGTCLPPKAQGPFSIRPGQDISIPFKNVFLQTVAISIQVDNPCFTVKGVNSIPPKKVCDLQVAFDPPEGSSESQWIGKLIVSSQRAEGHSKPCYWTFYLKGCCAKSGGSS